MPATAPVLVWFRQDLRLQDNQALAAAIDSGRPVIPVYIWSPDEEGGWVPGGAARWWLHQALQSLDDDLRGRGSRLVLAEGEALLALRLLIRKAGAEAVYWNRRYEPSAVSRDSEVKRALKEDGIEATSFNSSLLFEPQTVATNEGKPYQVYTPYWRNVKERSVPKPVETPYAVWSHPAGWPDGTKLDALGLMPVIPWYEKMAAFWTVSEQAAITRLRRYCKDGIQAYDDHRNRPDYDDTSHLSPYLHWGLIGPRQVWQAVRESDHSAKKGAQAFLRELVWREFAAHVLFHFPKTPEHPLREAYRDFPWETDKKALEAWQQGRTGYPIVDAGMRQLYAIGWMHNRVRMVVCSLLVKHLLQPWQDGARWFWDTLVDADLASNTLNWQWGAGCGADAAPYFRVFNPIIQGEKFDPEGAYIKRWVPELARLAPPHIHQPWETPGHVLEEAGIQLGDTYPEPIIEHRAGRERALAALEKMKA
ncbi:MAG: cryptochrome/photolyase family protein [Opitutales bacterium]